jgi:prepilin-type N-terminal cleavage/methylation domain-containing protein
MSHRLDIPYRAARDRRGFTIIELLVVISIILIAVVAILPAFGRLIESNNYASSINAVTATLGAARTRAVKYNHRSGVAFLWNAKEERMTLIIVEQSGASSGSLTDGVPTPCNRCGVPPTAGFAEVFVQAAGTSPIELPRGMGVFGLSSAVELICADTPLTESGGVTTWRWYGGDVIHSGGDVCDRSADLYTWLFPRNDPRVFTLKDTNSNVGVDPWLTLRGLTTSPLITVEEATTAVRNTTSFFIVFAPDGSIATSRRSANLEVFDAFLELADAPIDPTAPASPPYDDEFRFDPENTAGLPQNRRAANPEVVLRSADQLAVVDLARLADGVGFPRAWLIRPMQSRAPKPVDLTSAGYFNDERAQAVSRWIDVNAEILSFNRYSGNVIRRSSQ